MKETIVIQSDYKIKNIYRFLYTNWLKYGVENDGTRLPPIGMHALHSYTQDDIHLPSKLLSTLHSSVLAIFLNINSSHQNINF